MTVLLRKSLQSLIVLVGIFCLFAGNASAAKKVALVIGTDNYQNLPVLQKAVNDARAISETLTNIGFEVIKGENLTRRQMNRSLANLERTISPGDQVFFFFAGHGVALGATNYLIPADMPLPDAGEESLVRGEAFAVDQIVERIQSRGAIASFVVLDACRNNPFKTKGVRSIGTTRGLRDISTPKGVFVLFSAGIGQTALDRLHDDDSNPNSVFTRNLVPLLKQPGLSHVQLAKRVQSDVDKLARTVRHEQQPAYYDQVIGNMYLIKSNSDAKLEIQTTKSASSAVIDPARSVYNDIKDSGDIKTLEIFARQFPNSIYAKFAHGKIDALASKNKETLRVASIDTSTRDFRRSDSLLNECDSLAANKDDLDNKTGYASEYSSLEKNSKIAISACEAAIAKYPNDKQTLYQLGRSYSSAKQYDRAMKKFQLAMKNGYSYAAVNLGLLYQNGLGTSQNYKKAANLYKVASDKGIVSATTNLAFLYHYGQGVKHDYGEALRLYKIASDNGDISATTNLALLYYDGLGVSQDYKEAARLAKIASDKGYANATYGLGLMYLDGKGVRQDHKEASRLFEIAAQNGSPHATYSLANNYHDAIGVPQNYKKAASLMYKALHLKFDFALQQMSNKKLPRHTQFNRELQRIMKKNGFYDGAIDGNIGAATIAAIRKVAGRN